MCKEKANNPCKEIVEIQETQEKILKKMKGIKEMHNTFKDIRVIIRGLKGLAKIITLFGATYLIIRQIIKK